MLTTWKKSKMEMDFSKAFAIMGFSTSRILDKKFGHVSKTELDAALFRRMVDLGKKTKHANKQIGLVWVKILTVLGKC